MLRGPSTHWLLLLCVCVCPGTARADELPFDPSYRVDLYRTPVVGPAYIVGRGGTAIGSAEGSGAQAFNPAAVANRMAHTGGSWFDFDFSVDILSPGPIGPLRTDLDDLSGKAPLGAGTVFGNASIDFQFGRLGVGLMVTGQLYTFCFKQAMSQRHCDNPTQYSTTNASVTLGYSFLDDALVVAVGNAFVSSLFVLPSAHHVVDLGTAQPFAGALYRPHDAIWRVGLEARAPANLKPGTVPPVDDGLALPTGGAYAPWEVGVGAVVALGRTLNARPTFGASPYVPPSIPEGFFKHGLLSLDLLIVGGSSHASTISAWASGVLRQVRTHPTFAARVGIESEFWPHRMRGRFGNYWEQSRVRNVTSRFHVTGGLDVRLGHLFWDWRFSVAADVAPSYVNTLYSLGLWH